MFRSFRLVLFVCFLVVSAFAQPQSLELNKPLERALAGGQTHVYTLALNAPQIARIIAEQKGTDIVVTVNLPNGTKLFEVDSPNGSTGEEVATIAAQQSGGYRIEVRALNPNAPLGRYAIRLDKFLTETEFVTERLAAVGRLWGAVKYFHPYLAYKDIDWDGALVKALPAIKAARTPDAYRQAISGLLQALDDPATRVVMPAVATNATPATTTEEPIYFRVLGDYVMVNAAAWAAAMASKEKERSAAAYPQMMAALGKANGIILDCRANGVAVPEAYLNQFLQEFLPSLVQGNFPLGTERYRIHNGYAPQQGSTSGGYGAVLATRTPGTLVGKAEHKKPVAVVIDEKTPNVISWLSGLQAAGAKIIQVGKRSEIPNTPPRPVLLTDGVQVRLRLTEFVHPNGSLQFRADAQIPGATASDESILAAVRQSAPEKAAALPAPILREMKDHPYPQMSFPSEEYRLLALFRFWNVIHYFFPYKHLTDKPWNTVLTDFIPQFLANKTQLDYEMTVAEMIARMQDTHGFVRGLRALNAHLGEFTPPLHLRAAGGQIIVIQATAEAIAAGIRAGDVIVAVDGETVAQRIQHLAKFRALSNLSSAYRYVHPTVLRGAKDTQAKLRLQGADGQIREVEVPRSQAINSVANPLPRTTPIYEVLSQGYGYIDLARLPLAEANKAMDAMMNTPGLIFDMRGYPKGTAWTIAPRLTEQKNVTAALFRRPFLDATDWQNDDFGGPPPDYAFTQTLPPAQGAIYKGKVVMLINEDALSQAEYTCQFVAAATNVTFVGSPTNGANGDVTNLVLPGGISVSFTGHDVRHADGRQLQRIGIQPHLKVEPTPNGLREGRDEVLEAAVKFLQSTAQK